MKEMQVESKWSVVLLKKQRINEGGNRMTFRRKWVEGNKKYDFHKLET